MLKSIPANKEELKGQSVRVFQNMKNVEGVEVQTIRCDNAGENTELEKAMKSNGFKTRFEHTAADTPQQNGVVK